ncbi:MAG: hypothetical protein HOO96_39620, partial [Polyangiaceae bacterium]|nr:hypothetical protein [Polyangiaceae bacterium]
MRKWPRGLCVLVTVACTTEVPATVTEGSVRQITLATTVWARPRVFVVAVDDGDTEAARTLRAQVAAAMRAGALDYAFGTPHLDEDLADWAPAEGTLVLMEPTEPPVLHAHPYRTARRTKAAHAAWVEGIASDLEQWGGRRGRYALLESLRTTHDLLTRLRPVRGDDEARIMIDAPRDAELDATAITSRDDESEGNVQQYRAEASWILFSGPQVPRISECGYIRQWSADDNLFGAVTDAWFPLPDIARAAACVVHVYVPSLDACEPARGWQPPGPDTSAPLLADSPT